jgi:hypothetical protein
MLEKQVFVHGMETLKEAISSFLHICFIANLRFPVGSGILSTFLQRWVVKLDENGTTADRIKKDQVSKEDLQEIVRDIHIQDVCAPLVIWHGVKTEKL